MSVIEITSDNFESEVLHKEGLVLVDFSAESRCMPCRMLAPVLEEVADELDGNVVIGKVDTDENFELAVQFGIMSVPTLILFKDGSPLRQTVGYMPKDEVLSFIRN
ncbi:MAG: thioredoxin [Acutalibacteraceae bacterium]